MPTEIKNKAEELRQPANRIWNEEDPGDDAFAGAAFAWIEADEIDDEEND